MKSSVRKLFGRMSFVYTNVTHPLTYAVNGEKTSELISQQIT